MHIGARSIRRRGVLVVLAALAVAPATDAQAALRAPRLEGPAAASRVEALPTFEWGSVRGAARYEFQLAADRNFGSIVLGRGKGLGAQLTRNTAATLDKTVADGTYFWRVRAVSAKERAGAWSSARTVTKSWTTAPALSSPAEAASVQWPQDALVLRWSPVPRATKYLVSVATDDKLSQNVLSVSNTPIETQGPVYALQGALSPGVTYSWGITPVDAGGHRGRPSQVRHFTWNWDTRTTGAVTDLNGSAPVFDPLLSWSSIPGAARYEVEVNADDDFAPGSRVCCKERVLGTSLSPLRVLPNNRYNWRVRAFDADNNPGRWNVMTPFEKKYDDVLPSVPDVAVETVTSASAAAASPLVTWAPVPGASQYQVQWTARTGGVCGWTNASVSLKTSSLAWAPLSPTTPAGVPGGIGITPNLLPNGTGARWGQPFILERAYGFPAFQAFADGVEYCVRVRALSDDSFRENDNATSQVISQWTQAGGGENQPAFTYRAPPAPTTDPAPTQLPAPQYGTLPAVVARTPVLRWNQVPGARRYFVVIARDPDFTNVIDAAFTAMPAYVPNLALEDEDTSYYWAVIPASQSDGSGISGGPRSYDPHSFDKLSQPPTPLGPLAGAQEDTQPTFRWTPAESAQKYRVQVSTDPQFGDLLDDVVTSSTAYTSQTPYPVATTLYWRVRAEQQQVLQGVARVQLRWSATSTFRRGLTAPVMRSDNPTQGELIGAFGWSPVDGAISYDVHVDQADGITKDFAVKSAAFAPTQFYGTGVFALKVRANFATRSGSVASAYSDAGRYTRTVGAPTGTRLARSRTRLAFSWNPSPAAARYVVELSTSDSFSRLLETVRTDTTSWAPDLTSPVYQQAGTIYWRVAAVDSGNNIGAYARGRFGSPRRMRVALRGHLRHGRPGVLHVTVKSSAGSPLSKASVRISGAGMRTSRKPASRRGTLAARVRPRVRGTVTVTVHRSGYEDARRTVRVA